MRIDGPGEILGCGRLVVEISGQLDVYNWKNFQVFWIKATTILNVWVI